MKFVNTQVLTLFVLPLIVLFNPRFVRADSLARLYSQEGTVEVRAAGQGAWRAADRNAEFQSGDAVRTAPQSRAALLMSDGVMVRLGAEALFSFTLSKGGETFSVENGEAHFLSRKPTTIPSINTALVSASIRGTEFVVSAAPKEVRISVLQGALNARNDKGEVDASSQEEVVVKAGAAPQKVLMASPIDAVKWALYYPAPVEVDDFPDFVSSAPAAGIQALRERDYVNAESAFVGKGQRDLFGRALAAYGNGNVDAAIRYLDGVKQPWPASHALFRAALYLARGQVDKAEALHRTISGSPAGLEAMLRAQQAIIAVVQNKGDEARRIEQQYLINSESSGAAIARSYVLQSGFDLEAAKAVIEDAIARHPQNAYLRARHAELLLSFGKSQEGRAEAEKAVALAPADYYAETVRGFSELGLANFKEAAKAFERAISLSGGTGLPYLGLGLAVIRDGDLARGRVLLQQAAQLEPSVSLYRSYLGKAFFEQEEGNLAMQEYDLANTLDPNDPTPYFYRAFEQLDKNRPVEALRDIEKSIELNDDRAVYRSRLLLDQDAATRGTSLAEVYQTLGFAELARTEAIKSISRDYSNYSAHLLLSRSYEETFDLTQASISEFLIARLLSPVNFNLVRPSSGGGVSLNEYTTLFDRDQQRVAVGGTVQTKDRSGSPNVVVSGTSDNFGYALSHNTTYSDGYRDNDRLVEHVTYGSLQYQATPEDTLLFDANTDFYSSGDTQIGYDPHLNDTDSSQDLKDYILRFGMNHRFAPGSQFIAQVLGNSSDLTAKDSGFPRIVIVNALSGGEVIDTPILVGQAMQRTSFKSEGLRADAQYIFDSSYFSTVTGVGVLDSAQHLRDNGDTAFDEEIDDVLFTSRADNTEGSTRVFNYSTFHVTPWLDLQGGASYSKLHLSSAPLSVPVVELTESMHDWSPKAGFIMNPLGGTTVRGAFFETVGSSGIRELELIEPTIVGGFNQTVFDFFPGTRSRTLALGVDQKFSTETYLGVAGRDRHVIEHFPRTFDSISLDLDTGQVVDRDILITPDADNHMDEETFKTYVYQLICNGVSATADYNRFRLKDTALDTIARTNRLRFGMNYFNPDGLFTFVTATWRDQRLSGYGDEEGAEAVDGTRDFWLVDAGVGYRLPKRHGEISLAATNILDQDYRYLPSDADPLFFPGIGAVLRFSYNFEP